MLLSIASLVVVAKHKLVSFLASSLFAPITIGSFELRLKKKDRSLLPFKIMILQMSMTPMNHGRFSTSSASAPHLDEVFRVLS